MKELGYKIEVDNIEEVMKNAVSGGQSYYIFHL